MGIAQALDKTQHPLTSGSLCLDKLLSRQAERTPDAVALDDGTDTLTYRELNTLVTQLAWFLRERGVGPGVVVGLALHQSQKDLETLVAMFAIGRAGGAFLILDDYHPEETLRGMLLEAQVALVVAVEVGEVLRMERVTRSNVPILCLEDRALRDQIARQPFTPPVSGVAPSDLAYVIYTSGSTSRPKGVLCTHEALYPMAKYHGDFCDIKAGDRLAQFLPFRWDGSLFMIFLALGNGATLCLAPAEALRPGQQNVDWLERAGITHALFIPSFLEQTPHAPLPKLRHLILAGEACRTELADLWSAEWRQLYLAYGLSEGSICASIERRNGKPTMGFPLPYMHLEIWDETGQEVPPGTVGQLVQLNNLARGYTDERVTAERFPTLPDGSRVLLTGDLARSLPDGRLEYMGRRDDQRKRGGVLVNLTGVERTICTHPLVRSCKAILWDDGSLFAYVVLKEFGELDMSTLRSYLEKRLPLPERPSCCVEMVALPLNVNGKVATDQGAYPRPTEAATASYEIAFQRPETDTERNLAEVVVRMTRSQVKTDAPPTIDTVNVLLTLEELGIDSLAVGTFEMFAAQFTHRYLSEQQLALPLFQIALAFDGNKQSMPTEGELV